MGLKSWNNNHDESYLMTDNTQEQKRGKFGLVALFVLLVGLPAISWYYLQKGFNYSKEVFEQTATQGDIDSLGVEIVPLRFRADSLEEKAFLLVDKSRASNLDKLDLLQRQFNTNPNLYVFFQSETFEEPSVIPSGLYEYDLHTEYSMSELDAEHDIWLIDKEGQIRFRYKSADDEIWRIMARHLAFVVPKVKKDQLSIKRK